MNVGALLGKGRDLARMTREDAEQLTAVFLQVASRQARDAAVSARERLAAALAKRPL